jgi:hypothetical protein
MDRNIFDITDIDRKIYRIFSVKRFKELIESKRLVLVNPDKWDDPFENFFLKANAVEPSGALVSLETLAKSWYGQCWTFTKDSDALWRIYSSNKDGIRVTTTIRKLFNQIWDADDKFNTLNYFIGGVTYKSRSEIEELMNNTSFSDIAFGGQNNGFAKLLCLKRNEFSHESEVRILVNDNNKHGKNGCYEIEIEYQNIFEEICLDPRLEDREFQNLKNEIQKFSGAIPVTQSELYKVSFNPIKL